ncbi:Hypothetical protein MVR_LOCUS88 [uncultured virus]|nr:Hypothetical protein MVR_LOCUS88 [uncultured virus]
MPSYPSQEQPIAQVQFIYYETAFVASQDQVQSLATCSFIKRLVVESIESINLSSLNHVIIHELAVDSATVTDLDNLSVTVLQVKNGAKLVRCELARVHELVTDDIDSVEQFKSAKMLRFEAANVHKRGIKSKLPNLTSLQIKTTGNVYIKDNDYVSLSLTSDVQVDISQMTIAPNLETLAIDAPVIRGINMISKLPKCKNITLPPVAYQEYAKSNCRLINGERYPLLEDVVVSNEALDLGNVDSREAVMFRFALTVISAVVLALVVTAIVVFSKQ